jgi:PadR family transcriptional regulator PadR|tara:strand:- start:1810 stop:2157 length:348 start_codon:yes stop_codon:yes gene_type:complete
MHIFVGMNRSLLRGSLETIVIKLLSDNNEMYGYEITQKVKEITADQFKITEGALYPTLHKLEGKGVLECNTRSIGNRFRKYYSLTEAGQTELAIMLQDMEDYIKNMRLIINPQLS